MTKWDRLLVQLDKVFGFENRARSTVKKRRQLFDEKSNEHVFILEYRVVKGAGEHSDPKKSRLPQSQSSWLKSTGTTDESPPRAWNQELREPKPAPCLDFEVETSLHLTPQSLRC